MEDIEQLHKLIAEIQDLAIWMTGICAYTDYEYFLNKRHLLAIDSKEFLKQMNRRRYGQ